MKKILLALSLLGVQFALKAQTQPTNPSFETWETYLTVTEKPAAWNAGSVNCNTDATSTTCTQSVNKVSDAFDGTYAAKVINYEAVDFQTGTTELYTGTLMYIQDDMTFHPFTGRPVSLQGYYKYNQAVADDSVEVSIAILGPGGMSDIVAYGYAAFDSPQAAYTLFEIPLLYMGTSNPASISVNFMFTDGSSVNSDFTVDALTFDYSVTSNTPALSEAISFFPNPATEEIRFKDEVSSVVITSLQGQTVFNNPGETRSVYLGDINAGLYHISYVVKGERINSKLVIK